jgi:hypothetical protein
MHMGTEVGMPRCGVPAPCRRGTDRAMDSWPSTRSIPPLNAAGTAQRAIPTFVSSFAANSYANIRIRTALSERDCSR